MPADSLTQAFLSNLENASTTLQTVYLNCNREYKTTPELEHQFMLSIVELEYGLSSTIRSGRLFHEHLLREPLTTQKNAILQKKEILHSRISNLFYLFYFWADKKHMENAPANAPHMPQPVSCSTQQDFNPFLMPLGYYCPEVMTLAENFIQEKPVAPLWPLFGENHLKMCMLFMGELSQLMKRLETVYQAMEETCTAAEIKWSLEELDKVIYPADGQRLMRFKRYWYYPLRILGETGKYDYTETDYSKAIRILEMWGPVISVKLKEHNLQQESANFGNNHTTCLCWKKGSLKEQVWRRIQYIQIEFNRLMLQSHLRV